MNNVWGILGFVSTLIIASFAIRQMQKISKISKKQYLERMLAHIINSSTLLILYYLILCDAKFQNLSYFVFIHDRVVSSGLALVLSMLIIGFILRKIFNFVYDKLLKTDCVGEVVNNEINKRRLKGYINNREVFMDLILTSFMTALMVAVLLSAGLSLYCLFNKSNTFIVNLKENHIEFTNFAITCKWLALLLGKFVWFDGNVDWKNAKDIIFVAFKNIKSFDNIIFNLIFIAGIISGVFSLSIGVYTDPFAWGMFFGAILLLCIGIGILICNYFAKRKLTETHSL